MTDEPDEDLGRTVGAVLVDANGALLASVTATDGESFYSFLHVIADISDDLPDVDEVDEAYSSNSWFTAMDRTSSGAIFVCDNDGNVHSNRSGRWQVEQVAPDGGLRVLRCLADGSLVAAALGGTVYLLDGDRWTMIGSGFRNWINDISGHSGSDLLAVGDAGFVAHFDGSQWTRIDLATNATLNAVLHRADATYICGAGGALFRGSGDAWEDLTISGMGLYGLADYSGELWIACGGDGAGVFDGKGIDIRRDTFAAYEIHAAGAFIAFAGNDLVVRHDGKVWEGYGYGDD